MRVVLLGGAPGIGKTTTARRLMEFAQAGPDLVQWVDVDALWFHRPWRVDERTKAMVEANIRAVADHAAQAGVDVLLISWVFHTADMHRLVAGLLPPGSKITSVQLHAGHEVWTRRYTGDPERGGGPLVHHEDGYTATHAVPVDHVVTTDALNPTEVADAVALAIGGALARRVDQGASLAQTGAVTRVAVGHVEHPDVELTTGTNTFVQLAAGRIDPQRQIDAGLVTWTGNAELGDRAARNLKFTICPPDRTQRRSG